MEARILVIEDNPPNLELMVYLLDAFGHKALAARTGEQGLEIIQHEKLDLVICDIQLPGIDGYRIARWLKSHPTLRKMPLLAVTAFAMVGDRDRVLAAGFDGYIPKPITPETFVHEVEAFLKPASELTREEVPDLPKNSRYKEDVASNGERRPRILALDNSPINLSLAQCILEPLGFEVITADNARQALEMAKRINPDLLLSDVHMPEQDGFDFIKAVKADLQLRSIPFAFISSTVLLDSDRTRAFALGALKFIVRPIEPLALVAEIRDCLSKGAT